jgi:hypothetical protein
MYYWTGDGGSADDSYSKGEVASSTGHHKRSNETALVVRDGLKFGLAFYCVQCGFEGSTTLWGAFDYDVNSDFPYIHVTQAQAGLKANFKAGVNLGMMAFVKYTQSETVKLLTIPVGGFSIAEVIDVGPYISVSVKASMTIKATGQLLIGANIVWDNIDILLDLVNNDNSHVRNLVPRFDPVAQASGRLFMQASLGLPIGIGVQIDVSAPLVGNIWHADASIVDTPSIVAQGRFAIAGSIGDDGDFSLTINKGKSCYGITWSIFFTNQVPAVLDAKYFKYWTYDIVPIQKSAPIASGCIGYVDDGSDDDGSSDDSTGTGSVDGMAGNGLSSSGNGLAGGKNGGSSPGGSSSSSSSGSPTAAPAFAPAFAPAAAPSSSSVTTIIIQTTTSSTTTTTTTSRIQSSSSSPPSVQASSVAPQAKPSSLSTTTTRPTTTTTTTRTTTTTTTTKPACTPSSQATANPAMPTGLTCKKVANQASVATTLNVGQATTVATVDLCAVNCLKNTQCLSFGYSDKNSCQLYNRAVKNLNAATKTGSPNLTFYDKQCYAYNVCTK